MLIVCAKTCHSEGTTTVNFERNSVSAFVITRPPEILVCLKICSMTEFDLVTAPRDIFIVFDSHNRPAHPSGSGFIVSSSASEIVTYLDQLFALDTKVLSDPTIRWQAELLKQFSAHVLLPAKLPSDTYTLQAILMDASAMILQMKAKVADMEAKQAYLTTQNKEMHARIVDMEESYVSSDVKGKRKETGLSNDFFNASQNIGVRSLIPREASPEHNSVFFAATLQADYDDEDRILARQLSNNFIDIIILLQV